MSPMLFVNFFLFFACFIVDMIIYFNIDCLVWFCSVGLMLILRDSVLGLDCGGCGRRPFLHCSCDPRCGDYQKEERFEELLGEILVALSEKMISCQLSVSIALRIS
jgi:hypothetical protein